MIEIYKNYKNIAVKGNPVAVKKENEAKLNKMLQKNVNLVSD